MFKKLALIAAGALVLYTAVPAAPAAAQGINVQIGGGGYHRDHRGPGFRGDYRRHRDFGPRRHGWGRPRGERIIVR